MVSLVRRWQSRLRCRAFNEHDHHCSHPLTSGWVIEVWTDPAATFATYQPPARISRFRAWLVCQCVECGHYKEDHYRNDGCYGAGVRTGYIHVCPCSTPFAPPEIMRHAAPRKTLLARIRTWWKRWTHG